MRRQYDREKREVKENPSLSIIITWEGSRLPENVALYSGLVRLKVRAYVPSVIQCFKRYRYGHFNFIAETRKDVKYARMSFTVGAIEILDVSTAEDIIWLMTENVRNIGTTAH